MTSTRFSLKDHLFNEEKVTYLAGLLEAAVPGFDSAGFRSSVMQRLASLELKQRIALIAEIMADHLDPDFEIAAAQILDALPPQLDPTLADNDFGDFILAPFGKFIEDRGTDDYDTSMALIKEVTKRFSMEASVRAFLSSRPEATLALFSHWAEDPNYHVRRLVAESTRPRLPWAPRIDIDVRAPIRLLDKLHSDPTRYVTRSVANHVNDIAKTDPELALAVLARWHRVGAQSSVELEWMTTHALRTLVKQGHRGAFELLGYPSEPDVEVGSIEVATPVVPAGRSLEFSVRLFPARDERLIVDYAIDFVRSDGTMRRKVFKLKRLQSSAGQTTTVSKRHPLHADATTYTLSPGTHRLTLILNGTHVATAQFEVTLD